MSMPSYWFDPMVGGGGGVLGGNAATGQPALSAAQINASMGWNPNAAQFNPFANTPGGFGAQTAAYQQAAANSYGNINASTLYGGDQGAPQYDPWTGAISGYNAPRQYGWDANEGASAPAYTPPFQRGMFNPQTYGWDHNEGAPAPAQPSFNDIWSGRGAQGLARDNLFNSYTWPTPQPQLDFIDRGGFGMNLGGGASNQGTPQYDPWTGAITGYSGGGGYDMSARSRGVENPMNRVDWAQSYMPNFSTGGAMQQALLASQYKPFDTGGGYNPWASNNTSLPAYSNMFGAPSSGYLGSQGRLNQDPFGGYVNPRDLDAGGSFPGNYQPSYNALPLGWNNSFNN